MSGGREAALPEDADLPEERDVSDVEEQQGADKQAAAQVADEQADDADADDPTDGADTPRERRSDIVIVSLVFVVLYGYDLLEAIETVRLLPLLYEATGMAAQTPWVAIIAGVVAPPVLFALAMALGRGRRLVARAGILLVGVGVSAQVALLLESVTRALIGG